MRNCFSEISGPIFERCEVILFATILSSIFPTSFKWQIDLNDNGESTSFFSGLSIRTRLTTFANEPVRRHVLKKVVSISLSFRRIVSSTRPKYLPGVGQYFFSSYFQLPGRTLCPLLVEGTVQLCASRAVFLPASLGRVFIRIFPIFGSSILDVFVHCYTPDAVSVYF